MRLTKRTVIFFFICAFLFRVGAACDNWRTTFETCSDHTECIGYSSFPPEAVCMRRDDNRKMHQCVFNSTVTEGCMCFPSQYKFCTQHDQCPDRQYCGVSPTTGAKICLGCLASENEVLNFKPLGGKMPDKRCDPPSPHPPCGATLDLCSPTLPCEKGLQCLVFSGDKQFQCVDTVSPCRCVPPKSTPCDSDDDCEREREGCAYDLEDGTNQCISCDIIPQNPFLVFNSTSSKCNSLENRQPPTHYFAGANGLTYDLCNNDNECAGDRKCVFFKTSDKIPKPTAPCKSSSSLCFCREEELKDCTSGNECPNGESCVIAPVVDLDQHCASNSFIQGITRNEKEMQIVGKETPTRKAKSLKVTSQKCRFDWQCKGDRRCTYQGFQGGSWGGCAGRRACTCEPVLSVECSKHSDCDAQERCVRYIDGDSEPFCTAKSSKVFDISDQGLVVLVDEDIPETPPQIQSRGLTSDPCSAQTGCQDGRKCMNWLKTNTTCAEKDPLCHCVPTESNGCDKTDECVAGEVCTRIKDSASNSGTCESFDVFKKDRSGFLEALGGLPSPLPTMSMSPSGSPSPSVSPTSSFSSAPSVTSSVTPSMSSEADPSAAGSNLSGQGGMESAEPEESPEVEVCVDAKLLGHLSGNDLVFPVHRRASVLCDRAGTCATAGHMVVFDGAGMSMRLYCEKFVEGGCDKRVALVNSPRMSFGLRVESRTSRLHMTAHAARFGSRVEELVLGRLITSLGL